MNRNIIFVAAAGLLALALAVGGAGENFPLLEMMLDLAALGVGGVLIWKGSPERLHDPRALRTGADGGGRDPAVAPAGAFAAGRVAGAARARASGADRREPRASISGGR